MCLVCALTWNAHGIVTTLSKADPVPVYTTDSPFALLGTRHYEFLKKREEIDEQRHLSIELLPFYQRATRGNGPCGASTQLGDISGTWNLLAVLPYNKPTEPQEPLNLTSTNRDLPCGCTFPCVLIDTREDMLTDINSLFSQGATPEQLKSVSGLLQTQQTNQALAGAFGCFSAPMNYRKRGLRFNVEFYLGKGIGGTLQTGFVDAFQCTTGLIDLTNTVSGTQFNPFPTAGHDISVSGTAWTAVTNIVSVDLMSQVDNILKSIHQSLCPYQVRSMEDLFGELFWRYPVRVNDDLTTLEYPKFLFVPYFAVGGTYALSKIKNQQQLTSVMLGNNGHSALRVRGGFSLDFYDTIQVNFESGGTFFKSRMYSNVPVPTNMYQYPIYPFNTDMRVAPGPNWHVVIGMYAHHFLDNWSCDFDYIYVNHGKDHINIASPNYAAPAPDAATKACRTDKHPFTAEPLICRSEWMMQVLNATLGYDISPNFYLGAMMQIPVARKNAYRSATFALSLCARV